ncbi:restriction endonuclease [Pseudomonas xanthosomatis]|uniref:restriction endonuclease n=1 Tax=Pseudomonas xanthosomatis TaxID=2842356 RepID=UPI001C3D997B|nr:restriction endonuclease [Pseudomonas xanthosomatis]QXH45088.1 restriction endonuclease [Pseudomonas xanthosomatis]
MQVNAIKPNLYRGQPLPLHALSPSAFENFTYQALSFLGAKHGFKMKSGPLQSTDQGYDCTAASTTDKHIICIQCKRYNTALSLKTVAEEVLKVALDNKLNNSNCKQHYIITSGEVTGNLRQAERQDSLTDLKNECTKIINSGKIQSKLISRMKSQNLDPTQVISEYLDALENLTIWSGTDLQNELTTIWSKLSDVLEQNFSIEKVLLDRPTPDFDVRAYLDKISHSAIKLTPLNYFPTTLPSNLVSDNNVSDPGTIVIPIDDLIEILKTGKNVVLSSRGGSGKSSTLVMTEHKLAQPVSDIRWVPVKLSLRSYSRNMLNQMIENALGINYGSWRSLPFKFIFLLDGLDEMLEHDTQALFDDIDMTMNEYSYVITVRDRGISIETKSNSINLCLAIQPLSYRSAFSIASSLFQPPELDEFYDQYRKRLNSVDFDFFSLPFVLSRSIDYYKKNKILPTSTEDILEDWISSKLKNDQSRVTNTSLKLNKLPIHKVTDTLSTVLYKAKFGSGVSSIPEDIYIDLMVACHDELIASDPYLAKALEFDEFLKLITEYEVLYKYSDGHYSTPHLIISDYLASKTLAKKWREHQAYSFNNSHHDIWLFSSNFIEATDRSEYLATVEKFDISLMAKIARKFKGDFLSYAEEKILELETSEKVMTRSQAIYALGILGTDDSLRRLKSKQGLKDIQQYYQRRRALALNGDDETLLNILHDNEPRAQMPARISGGEYDLWFRCPPAKITHIARNRINTWIGDRQPGLCINLRTLELFGDSTDCDNLLYILNNTEFSKEFFDASRALLEIDRDLACKTLITLSNEDTVVAYWSKQVLDAIGIRFNIDNDFEFFIQLGQQGNEQLASEHTADVARKIVDLLKNADLDSKKVDALIATYRNLTLTKDYYYYNLIWQLGLRGEPGCLIPLVKLAYSRKTPDEIHNAIWYLSKSSEAEIDPELELEIDEYFKSMNEHHLGTYYNYLIYYKNTKPRAYTLDLTRKKISTLLSNLNPETLTSDSYTVNGVFSYDLVFDLLSTFSGDACISAEDSLKLLLINTDFSNQKTKNIKHGTLAGIDKSTIQDYIDLIVDNGARLRITSYILENNLAKDPIALAEQHLSTFFSHHAFYPAVAALCATHWNDKLAKIFLNEFCTFDWNPYTVQIFDRYTDLYLELLTREQLEDFEGSRTTPVNEHIERTYKIFIETHKLTMR